MPKDWRSPVLSKHDLIELVKRYLLTIEDYQDRRERERYLWYVYVRNFGASQEKARDDADEYEKNLTQRIEARRKASWDDHDKTPANEVARIYMGHVLSEFAAFVSSSISEAE